MERHEPIVIIFRKRQREADLRLKKIMNEQFIKLLIKTKKGRQDNGKGQKKEKKEKKKRNLNTVEHSIKKKEKTNIFLGKIDST